MKIVHSPELANFNHDFATDIVNFLGPDHELTADQVLEKIEDFMKGRAPVVKIQKRKPHPGVYSNKTPYGIANHNEDNT